MLVNEYKLYISIHKSSKDAKFGQCLYLGVPFAMSRTDAQNGVEISEIINDATFYVC